VRVISTTIQMAPAFAELPTVPEPKNTQVRTAEGGKASTRQNRRPPRPDHEKTFAVPPYDQHDRRWQHQGAYPTGITIRENRTRLRHPNRCRERGHHQIEGSLLPQGNRRKAGAHRGRESAATAHAPSRAKPTPGTSAYNPFYVRSELSSTTSGSRLAAVHE
jgi:hypothetical protein